MVGVWGWLGSPGGRPGDLGMGGPPKGWWGHPLAVVGGQGGGGGHGVVGSRWVGVWLGSRGGIYI